MCTKVQPGSAMARDAIAAFFHVSGAWATQARHIGQGSATSYPLGIDPRNATFALLATEQNGPLLKGSVTRRKRKSVGHLTSAPA